MGIFSVTAETSGYEGKRRPLRILLMAGFFAASQVLFQVLWPSGMKMGHLWGFTVAVIFGVGFALLFEFMFAKHLFPYVLIASDDCIAAVHPGYEKSIRKDEVKTVTQTKGNAFFGAGLLISKYGRLGTWLWGCILIPKTLPEYESIMNLALSWKCPTRV